MGAISVTQLISSGSTEPAFVGHSPDSNGVWQSLRHHTLQVATLAAGFAESFGCRELAWWAGLAHDLGKYSPEFQQYLRDCSDAKRLGHTPPKPGSAPHKQAGAQWAEPELGAIFALAILGHHGQVPSRAEAKAALKTVTPDALEVILERARLDCPELFEDIRPIRELQKRLCPDPISAEFLARMIYSCLVDADSLDTENHFNPRDFQLRQSPFPSLTEMRDRLRAAQDSLIRSAPKSELNDVRREVYEACVSAARLEPGVFRLTVPTGGGKTRSSLAFALEHAVTHGLSRVIYAIPYTSIVDQTAAVFEGILGADAILEHHSALDPADRDAEEDYERRLICQNWDAPLVLTTTVQLFESLFGNRPGKCRKVHRLSRAVIVLDEVQALPPKLLSPIVDALRRLAESYGATVLLCTATQPALDTSVLKRVGLTNVREIAPEPARLFQSLRRVTYDLSPLARPWSWEDVADALREAESGMVVLNTRKDAMAVLDALDDPDALHLSTLLCGRHRREVLDEVRRRLRMGLPCRLVATQVVECGCDLDFPLVLRALGPLDRVVQAAGRCNREGLRDADSSRVALFQPAEGSAPRGSYQVALTAAERMLRAGPDLHDPELYDRYFREVFRADDTDAGKVQDARRRFAFPEVSDAMRLITDDTQPVLVRYRPADSDVTELLERVRTARRVSRSQWRELQPFLVSIRRRDFQRYQRDHMAIEVIPGSGLWEWLGGYDSVRGIQEVERDPADLIL